MAITKKLCTLVPALLLALSLAACAGIPGVPDAPSNDKISASAAPAADPCPCCPVCIQQDCACADCGDSEACECAAPGSGAIYTISAGGTDKHIENEYAKFDFTIMFSAENEGDGLYGDYTGIGELRIDYDETDYLAAMGGQMTSAKLVIDGLLNNIRFTLEEPRSEDEPHIIARGSGAMQWDNAVIENIFVTKDGGITFIPWNGNSTEHFTIEIEIYDSGDGVLYISYYFASLSYPLRLTMH